MDFVCEVTTSSRHGGYVPGQVTCVEIGNCFMCLEAGENGQRCVNCQTAWFKKVEVDDDYGRRTAWREIPNSENKGPDAKQFKNNVYQIAMTDYQMFIHPIALSRAVQKNGQVFPNMAKRQGTGAYPRTTFVLDRARHNEINSRSTNARKHFRERLQAAMENIEQHEHTIVDYRLIHQLKHKDRQDHISPIEDEESHRIGNCIACGRCGKEGYRCTSCANGRIQVFYIEDRHADSEDGVHLFPDPHIMSQALTEANEAQEAIHDFADWIPGIEHRSFDFEMVRQLEPTTLDRLSKLSSCETLIVMKHIEQDPPPPALQWLDRLRRMTKVEATMAEQGVDEDTIDTALAMI